MVGGYTNKVFSRDRDVQSIIKFQIAFVVSNDTRS
jgi:hypothetical protein